MARKHENFSYNYGFRSAPEQWNFFLNNKLIELDNETRTDLACLCLSGKVKEAEDRLKRMLRSDEKTPLTVGKCICFFKEGSDEFYYYTRQLRYTPENRKEALYSYKSWKQYIKDKDCILENGYEVTSGSFDPFANNNKSTKKVITNKVDLTRCRTIRVIRRSIFK